MDTLLFENPKNDPVAALTAPVPAHPHDDLRLLQDLARSMTGLLAIRLI